MEMNVLTEEGKKKYIEQMMSEKFYNTMTVYMKTLAKEWHFRNENEYPFRIGLVFGLPLFEFSQTMMSKDELFGRIKMLAQLTGHTEIDVVKDNTTIRIKLENGNKKQ